MDSRTGRARYQCADTALVRAAQHTGLALPVWPDLTYDTPAHARQWRGWLRKVWALEEVAAAVEHASPVFARQVEAVCVAPNPDVRQARRTALHQTSRLATTTRRRLDRAHARLDRGSELPALVEFDGIRGLAGIGAYLLHRAQHEDLLRAVLAYLVRLTDPVTDDGDVLPGWWSGLAPSGRPSPDYPGGHGNNGVAHGICVISGVKLTLAGRREIRRSGT